MKLWQIYTSLNIYLLSIKKYLLLKQIKTIKTTKNKIKDKTQYKQSKQIKIIKIIPRLHIRPRLPMKVCSEGTSHHSCL
jgi:hypothetical protein